jgi:uncharacterized protein YjbI with pentapeptide repeats
MPESTMLRQPVDPLYQYLRVRKAGQFSTRRQSAGPYDLHSCDMRGVDLRKCRPEDARLHGAHICGAYFPDLIDAAETDMSVRLGIRIRTRQG